MASFDQAQQWVANNGFAVVIALLLLWMLRDMVLSAVGQFNKRLDALTHAQTSAVQQLTGSIEHLDHTLDRVARQSAANHEALSILMRFLSHTQQEIVAHRATVENGDTSDIPSRTIQTRAADT